MRGKVYRETVCLTQQVYTQYGEWGWGFPLLDRSFSPWCRQKCLLSERWTVKVYVCLLYSQDCIDTSWCRHWRGDTCCFLPLSRSKVLGAVSGQGKGLAPVTSWRYSRQAGQSVHVIYRFCVGIYYGRLPDLSFWGVALFRFQAAFKTECSSLEWR